MLPPKRSGPGRPRANDRDVLEGILWILRTGAPWQNLPDIYPSPSTCWRRLKQWEEQDIWLLIWRTFLSELDANGALDWQESFIDGSFAPGAGRCGFEGCFPAQTNGPESLGPLEPPRPLPAYGLHAQMRAVQQPCPCQGLPRLAGRLRLKRRGDKEIASVGWEAERRHWGIRISRDASPLARRGAASRDGYRGPDQGAGRPRPLGTPGLFARIWASVPGCGRRTSMPARTNKLAERFHRILGNEHFVITRIKWHEFIEEM